MSPKNNSEKNVFKPNYQCNAHEQSQTRFYGLALFSAYQTEKLTRTGTANCCCAPGHQVNSYNPLKMWNTESEICQNKKERYHKNAAKKQHW